MVSQIFLLPFLFAAFVLAKQIPVEFDHSLEATHVQDEETVYVKIFYESYCIYCCDEFRDELVPLVKKLGPNINLQTYPYGDAKMHTEDGKTVVKCPHGEEECYCNKLQACAIDYLKNALDYVTFNSCVMNKLDKLTCDQAVDECGKKLGVDSKPIKNCAQGSKGQDLLIYYGKESEKIKYPGVPWVLVDDTPLYGSNKTLMEAVCDAFKHPPKACENKSDASSFVRT